MHVARDQAEDLVAVDDFAALIGEDDAVGIAVERDADIGAMFQHGGAEVFRDGGADILVDVEPVRLDADGDDRGAEFPEGGGGDFIGGTVRAIEHDAQAVQAQAALQGGFGGFDIAAGGVHQARGAAETVRGGEAGGEIGLHQGFDLKLGFIRELRTVRAEQLDAVILIRVVRGGDDDAEVQAQRAGEHGDGRSRQGAGQGDVHAGADEAGGQGRFQHIAGEPRVLADDDAVAVVAAREQQPGGLAEFQGDFGGHGGGVGFAANAIGAEQTAFGFKFHHLPLSVSARRARPAPSPARHARAVYGRLGPRA